MASVEKSVQEVLKEINFVLTKGLTEEESNRVVAMFRDEILPIRMKNVEFDDDEQTAGRIEIVIADYAKQLAGLSPEQKVAKIKLLFLAAKLDVISDAAFNLAVAKSKNEAVDKGVGAMCLASLKAFQQDLSAAPVEIQTALADLISETSLDLMYSLGATNAISLRLSHLLGVPNDYSGASAMKQEKHCEECGKTLDPNATVCPRCGHLIGGSTNPAPPSNVQSPPAQAPTAQPVQPKVSSVPTPPPTLTPDAPKQSNPGNCVKCGASLTPGKKFCTKCGSPIA